MQIRIAKPKYLFLALFFILIVWFFNPFAEGFESSVEPVKEQSEAGCPCSTSAECKSLRCKGGRCADYLGNVPDDEPRTGCPFRKDIQATHYKEKELGQPGCPCNSSAECTGLLCRQGRCTNWLGIIPAERPSLEDCPYRVD